MKLLNIISIIIILINLINFINGKECKVSVLFSGDYNDLGYNYMFNDARVRSERILGLNTIYYKHLEESPELSEWAVQDSIKRGANLIVFSSYVHNALGLKYATLYKDEPIYFLIRGNKRPSPDLPKVVILNFNSFELHYILGYYAGLMSKTGTIGFVAPGPDINTLSTDNSFYLGARHARNNITFLNIYTGSWYNPEVAYRASQFLIDNGADTIGMSQDDMSVQKAIMDNGYVAMGVTGYPGRYIYGADVGISYITNWTDVFVKYAGHVINEDWPNYSSYFTNLSREDSIFIDQMSFKVPIDVQSKVNQKITDLKDVNYVPYRSDPYLAQLGIPYVNGLLTDGLFRANKILLKGDEFSKVIDFGMYTIPIEFVDYPNSLKVGVAVASGICILLCIISMVLVVVFRNARVIKSSSPTFCLLILFGCIIIFTGCIIFAQSPTDYTCRTRVWLLSIGYTIFLGNLLVKNWRIWLLFDNPKLKRRALTNWKLLPWVMGILAADVLILGIWQGIGGIVSESRTGIDSLSKYEYSNVCTNNDKGSVALYILIVFHGIKLLVACFISFKIKVVDIEEFNESKPITTSVYIITFCLFIVIPLMVSPQSISSQATIICVCAIVTTMLSFTILFGSKFYKMATQGLAMNETFATSTSKSSSFNGSLEKGGKRSVKSSKSSITKDNVYNIDDDTSDETSDEKPVSKPMKSHSSSIGNSNLALFTSDDASSSKLSVDQESREIEKLEIKEREIEKQQEQVQQIEVEIKEEEQREQEVKEEVSNVSEVQAKRLSNQLNGETEIKPEDV